MTGSDADHEWQRGLIADPTLNDLFDEQVSSRTRTADAVRRFAALWPIFRVSKLRERGIDYWSGIHDSRAEMTRAYIDARPVSRPRSISARRLRPAPLPLRATSSA